MVNIQNPRQAIIDSNCLVIPTKTALPERCVRTNIVTSGSDYKLWDLPYIPRWLVIVMLISPVFLLFTPVIVKRRCKFKAGLSKKVRHNYFLRKVLAITLILGPLLSIPIAANLSESGQLLPVAFALTLLCPYLGFVILVLWSSPLVIMREKDQLYWIKGCSSEFLDSLKEVSSSSI